MQYTGIRELTKFEGTILHFLGDELSGPRNGVITDIVMPDDGDGPAAVVMWDETEYVGYDQTGKEIMVYDDVGVCVIPLFELLKSEDFKLSPYIPKKKIKR